MTNRHRERLLELTQATGTWRRFSSAGNLVTEETYPTVPSKVTESMDDVVVPNFSTRSNAGDIIINPLLYVKETFKTVGGPATVWFQHVNGHQQEHVGPGVCAVIAAVHNGYGYTFAAEPDIDLQELVEASRLIALGNVDRAPYSFAEDLAEMRETLKFLKDPLDSIRALSDELWWDVRFLLEKTKKGKSNALTLAQAIANVWTSYRFAFSPLVRSVSDAIASVSDNTTPPVRRTARGHREVSEENLEMESLGNFEYSTTVEYLVRSGVLYEDSNPFQGWRDKYGLRFKDIPETLWAVMPLSFMVDRVLNISAALRGVNAFLDPSIEMLGAWTTVRKKVVKTRACIGYNNPGLIKSSQITNPEVDVEEIFTLTREKWDPSVDALIPNFDISGLIDTSTKLADLTALLLQKLR